METAGIEPAEDACKASSPGLGTFAPEIEQRSARESNPACHHTRVACCPNTCRPAEVPAGLEPAPPGGPGFLSVRPGEPGVRAAPAPKGIGAAGRTTGPIPAERWGRRTTIG